jgi:pyruvate formate lyase activating enzyme
MAATEPSKTPLEAKSPYELRVNLGKDVPESDVRTALSTGEMGFLHSFTTGSAVDGPGIRVVAWTTGCMYRCLYCHNPDTWTMSNGIPVSVGHALEQLNRYKHGLKIMSGGFTLSGGEPLMQHRFAVRLLSGARKLGIHAALDSNGYYGDKLSDEEFDAFDLVLLDIKAWDPALHKRLTGMEPEPTLAFARRLAARKKPIWLRYVLVPGLTDDPGDITKIAEFAAGLGNVERVDVLPFHQLGLHKWEKLSIDYTLAETKPPTAEVVERTCAIYRDKGLKAY